MSQEKQSEFETKHAMRQLAERIGRAEPVRAARMKMQEAWIEEWKARREALGEKFEMNFLSGAPQMVAPIGLEGLINRMGWTKEQEQKIRPAMEKSQESVRAFWEAADREWKKLEDAMRHGGEFSTTVMILMMTEDNIAAAQAFDPEKINPQLQEMNRQMAEAERKLLKSWQDFLAVDRVREKMPKAEAATPEMSRHAAAIASGIAKAQPVEMTHLRDALADQFSRFVELEKAFPKSEQAKQAAVEKTPEKRSGIRARYFMQDELLQRPSRRAEASEARLIEHIRKAAPGASEEMQALILQKLEAEAMAAAIEKSLKAEPQAPAKKAPPPKAALAEDIQALADAAMRAGGASERSSIPPFSPRASTYMRST